MSREIKKKIIKTKSDKTELLKIVAEEFAKLFEEAWLEQLPMVPHDKRELMAGYLRPDGFTDAMTVFFTGMCYKAQDRALDKLIIKFKAMRNL